VTGCSRFCLRGRSVGLEVEGIESCHIAISPRRTIIALGKLTDLTAGGLLDPFDERVLEVLDVRSGTAREALGLDDADVERWILATIEENSGTVYSHIEAEIEEKIDTFAQSYSFSEAVAEAVKGSVAEVVEEIIEDRISTDFLDADATDVVRKGLRSLL